MRFTFCSHAGKYKPVLYNIKLAFICNMGVIKVLLTVLILFYVNGINLIVYNIFSWNFSVLYRYVWLPIARV